MRSNVTEQWLGTRRWWPRLRRHVAERPQLRIRRGTWLRWLAANAVR